LTKTGGERIALLQYFFTLGDREHKDIPSRKSYNNYSHDLLAAISIHSIEKRNSE
jgi:hypothetical protein